LQQIFSEIPPPPLNTLWGVSSGPRSPILAPNGGNFLGKVLKKMGFFGVSRVFQIFEDWGFF